MPRNTKLPFSGYPAVLTVAAPCWGQNFSLGRGSPPLADEIGHCEPIMVNRHRAHSESACMSGWGGQQWFSDWKNCHGNTPRGSRVLSLQLNCCHSRSHHGAAATLGCCGEDQCAINQSSEAEVKRPTIAAWANQKRAIRQRPPAACLPSPIRATVRRSPWLYTYDSLRLQRHCGTCNGCLW